MQTLFINHCKTAMSLPDLYDGQDLARQWLDLLIDSLGKLESYLHE
jgi:hypothetical protein